MGFPMDLIEDNSLKVTGDGFESVKAWRAMCERLLAN